MIKKLISGIMISFLALLLLGISVFAIQLIPMTLLGASETLNLASNIIILVATEIFFALVIAGILVVMYLVYLYFKNFAYTERFIKGLNKLIVITLLTSVVLITFGIYLVFSSPIVLLDLLIGLGFILVIWILAAVTALIRVIIIDTIEFKDENELVV